MVKEEVSAFPPDYIDLVSEKTLEKFGETVVEAAGIEPAQDDSVAPDKPGNDEGSSDPSEM